MRTVFNNSITSDYWQQQNSTFIAKHQHRSSETTTENYTILTNTSAQVDQSSY
jgi:protein gp37